MLQRWTAQVREFFIPPAPPVFRPRVRRTLAVLAALCTLVAGAYLGVGFYRLTLEPKAEAGPVDLASRWGESQYVMDGLNPHDAWFVQADPGTLPYIRAAGREPVYNPRYGALYPGYPPWSFTLGYLLFWPSEFAYVRWYVAALSVLCLGVCAGFAYAVGRPFGWEAGWLAASLVLASGPLGYTLHLGQYGLLVTALLCAFHFACQQRSWLAAGGALALAAIKPSISAPFGLLLLFPPRWRALGVVAAILGITTAVSSWSCRTSLSEMLGAVQIGSVFFKRNQNPVEDLFAALQVPHAAEVAPLVCLSLAAGLLFAWRRASLLVQFAIAAVAARLWTHHSSYDGVMMIFLQLALLQLALRRPTALNLTTIIVVSGTLMWPAWNWWMPHYLIYQSVQVVSWGLGLAVLLAQTPRRKAAVPPAALA